MTDAEREAKEIALSTLLKKCFCGEDGFGGEVVTCTICLLTKRIAESIQRAEQRGREFTAKHGLDAGARMAAYNKGLNERLTIPTAKALKETDRKARAEENEECAKVADTCWTLRSKESPKGYHCCGKQIALAIRASIKEPEDG